MNTGLKPTNVIHPNPAMMIADATVTAHILGFPLNTSIAIKLLLASIFDHHHFITSFLHKYRDFLKYHCNIPPYYIWVLENPDGKLNVHIQLHCPPDLFKTLSTMTHEWLAQLDGIDAAKALQCQQLAQPGDQFRKTQYLLKGASPEFCDQHNIHHDPQGITHGKRTGVSITLGPSKIIRLPTTLDCDYFTLDFPHLAFRPYN